MVRQNYSKFTTPWYLMVYPSYMLRTCHRKITDVNQVLLNIIFVSFVLLACAECTRQRQETNPKSSSMEVKHSVD